MQNLERIEGLAQVVEQLPEELRCWYKFGDIISLEYHKYYDNEKWQNVSDVKMIVTDDSKACKIQLHLKNAQGELGLIIGNKVSGFAIKDMKMDGYENSAGFRVYDFEDGELSIYCEGISVALV